MLQFIKTRHRELRCLTAMLAVIMTVLAVPVQAASVFYDTDGHWALTSIDYMVKKGVLSGYTDGSFRPDATVTRAEFVKMTVETFGLVGSVSPGFADVAPSDWYYPYVASAKAQGFLIDYGTYFNPNTEMTREEAVTLVSRYLDLPADKTHTSAVYADYNTITPEYRAHVLRASYAGLIKGYPDITFRPQKTLTRAEALVVLCRAAGTIYDDTADSIYDDSTGNAVVTTSNRRLEDVHVDGDMLITEGAAGGMLELVDCSIGGTLHIRSNATILLYGCDVGRVAVDLTLGETARIGVKDFTRIERMEMLTPTGVRRGCF